MKKIDNESSNSGQITKCMIHLKNSERNIVITEKDSSAKNLIKLIENFYESLTNKNNMEYNKSKVVLKIVTKNDVLFAKEEDISAIHIFSQEALDSTDTKTIDKEFIKNEEEKIYIPLDKKLEIEDIVNEYDLENLDKKENNIIDNDKENIEYEDYEETDLPNPEKLLKDEEKNELDETKEGINFLDMISNRLKNKDNS